jgi:hypothetical protein
LNILKQRRKRNINAYWEAIKYILTEKYYISL